jgi:hypothetical protein
LFWQQPSGHDWALHTQLPPTHARFCPHASLTPHAQVPLDAQPSEWKSHATHAPPPVPQALTDAGVHVWPEQQPFGQVVSLQSAQAPALQIKPLQFWQAAPPAPHRAFSLPDSQLPLEQQPLHDWLSQMHLPPEQRWPAVHAALPPQVQVPDEGEQPSPEVPHVWQACPATPQATPVGGAVHTPLVQQPVAHDVGVH